MRAVNFPTDPQDAVDARDIPSHELEAKREEMLYDRMHDVELAMDYLSPGEWNDYQSDLFKLALEDINEGDYCAAGEKFKQILEYGLTPSDSDVEYAIRYEDTLE